VHVLQELAARLHALDRPRVLIAEDERNERRVVLPREQGGLGLDGVWADDLHHQLRRLAAGDREGYFAAFGGTIADVVATLRKGWFYEGQRAGDHARGTPADGLPPRAFVHCLQNHDQVGNRAMGDRLHHVVPLPVYRALSALLLLSPYTPLLWMGQEWAASTPFLYFTDHPEPLGRLVTAGRRAEFGGFAAFADPALRERIPDPQAAETFERSKLRWAERTEPPHAGVLALYRALLALRRAEPALRARGREHFAVAALGEGALALRRTSPAGDALLLVASVAGAASVALDATAETRLDDGRRWAPVLDTEEARSAAARTRGRCSRAAASRCARPARSCSAPSASARPPEAGAASRRADGHPRAATRAGASLARAARTPRPRPPSERSSPAMAEPQRDPKEQGAKPPYPAKPQEPPGTERELTPDADHGETSYRGSGRLAGKTALITGGDSGIGRAVALAFAREGADVLVSYLDEHEDARETQRLVEAEGRRALVIAGDIGEEAHCRASSRGAWRARAASTCS
jgi:hypothetical protein